MLARRKGWLQRIGLGWAAPEERARRTRIKEIEEFFAEDDRPGLAYPFLAYSLTLLAVVTSASWIWLFLTGKGPSDPPVLLGLKYDKLVGLLAFLSAFFASLVASVIAVAMINRVNLAKIKFVKDLTEVDAVKTVLMNLNSYGGRYSESKHVEIVFENLKVGSKGLAAIKVTHTVRVRMPIQRKELILDFVKLDRSIGPGADLITYDLQSDAVPDDAQWIDVTDIKQSFPDEYEHMFPGLVEVIVASQPYRVDPEFVDERRNHRRWRIDTKRHIGGGPVDVVYRYSYYHEATGFAFQQISEPTRGFLYSLNYEGVGDDLAVYQIGNLNARESGQDIRKRPHQLEVSTSEWVVPSTMIVFCWYYKGGQAADDGPERADGAAALPAAAAPGGDPGALGQPGWPAGLSIDGNCLGVALCDALAPLGASPGDADLKDLATPADAVAVLRAVPGIDVALVAPPGWLARLLFKLQSRRFGIPLAQKDLMEGEIALCMRSMRQLYGLKRVEAHWVVVTGTAQGPVLLDRLGQGVRDTFLGVREATAAEVLDAAGVTLKVRKQ